MTIIDTFNDALGVVNTYVWYVAFILLIGAGLYFTYKLRGLQILKIRETAKLALSGIGEGDKTEAVSSFEAFCIGVGTRVGVGNIAGVAMAIVAGGPGAVFWMWVFAIIGSASSFVESTLSQLFKEKKEDGQYHGGPAYYIQKGLGTRKVAILMAFLIAMMTGIGFCAAQASSSVEALTSTFVFDNNTLVFGLVITILTGLIIFGGMKRIATFSSKIVPLMAVAWLALGTITIVMNIDGLINAFVMIFSYAFGFEQVAGGLLGAVIMTGLKRGIFSNESGLGTIANIAGTADVKHPVKQGLIQCFGTLVDTLVVCTFTAMVILTAFDDYGAILDTGLSNSPLVEYVLNDTIGHIGSILMSLFLLFFAFTSLLGNYAISETNVRFISDRKMSIMVMRIAVVVTVFIASLIGADASILISDTIMAFAGVVNISCVILLSSLAFQAYADWRKQKSEGIEDPVFHRDTLDDATGITEWE
ncbi:MAG: alanine:cation symporter family protein [Candidatus Methanomethylophilaceae archaeon]|nr:alanine:cation symporter family protein [Candidatus Methanomethylophilaceae archaeon]